MTAMKCCNECQQGRKPCPTPESCELPETESHHAAAMTVTVMALAWAVAIILWALL